MFGRTNRVLNMNSIENLGIDLNEERLNGVKLVKEACKPYFIVVKNPEGVLYWDAGLKKIKHYTFDDFKKKFFAKKRIANVLEIVDGILQIKRQESIYDIIVKGEKYYQDFDAQMPLFFSFGNSHFVNLFDDVKFSPYNLQYDDDDKSGLLLLLEELFNICGNNFYYFNEIITLLYCAVSGTRHDKIINIYGNDDVIKIIEFIARSVVGKRNSSVDQNFGKFKDGTSAFHGKSLVVVEKDDDSDDIHDIKQIIRVMLAEKTSIHKVNNVINVIVASKENIFNSEYGSEIIVVAINAEKYVYNTELDKYLKTGILFGEKVRHLIKQHHKPNFGYKKRHEVTEKTIFTNTVGTVYNNNVYDKFYRYASRYLYKNTKPTIIKFHREFIHKYPSMLNYNVEKFNAVYNDLVVRKNNNVKKKQKMKNDSLNFSNNMLIQKYLIHDNLEIFLKFIRDIYWTNGLDIETSYVRFCDDLKTYSQVLYNHASIVKSVIMNKINDIFGDKSISCKNKIYMIDIPFKKINKVFIQNRWIGPLDITIDNND